MSEEEFPTHVLQKRTLTKGVASRLGDGHLAFGLCGLDQLPSLMAPAHTLKKVIEKPHMDTNGVSVFYKQKS